MKRVLMHLLVSILATLVVALCVGILAMFIHVLIAVACETFLSMLGGRDWTMSASQLFWCYMISGAVLTPVVVAIVAASSYKTGLCRGVEKLWAKREVPLTEDEASKSALPVLFLGLVACVITVVSVCLFHGQIIATVEEIIITNLWDGDGIWIMIGGVGMIFSPCIAFVSYFVAMKVIYVKKSCGRCTKLGWGDYGYNGKRESVHQSYRETTKRKEFRWTDSDHNSDYIRYEVPAYAKQETRVTTKYYSGRCKFCGHVNCKERQSSSTYDI